MFPFLSSHCPMAQPHEHRLSHAFATFQPPSLPPDQPHCHISFLFFQYPGHAASQHLFLRRNCRAPHPPRCALHLRSTVRDRAASHLSPCIHDPFPDEPLPLDSPHGRVSLWHASAAPQAASPPFLFRYGQPLYTIYYYSRWRKEFLLKSSFIYTFFCMIIIIYVQQQAAFYRTPIHASKKRCLESEKSTCIFSTIALYY